MRFLTLLLDLDGTLLDSGRLALETARVGLGELGCPVPDQEQILSLIGRPEEEYYRGLLPGSAPEAWVDKLRQHEIAELRQNAPLYPGVLELLRELFASGRRLGLVTNAGRGYMQAALESSGLDECLHVALCVDDDPQGGKPALVGRALRELQGPAAMIGDRASDLEAGRAHGLFTIACGWGFGSKEELAGADARVEDLEGLRALLAQDQTHEQDSLQVQERSRKGCGRTSRSRGPAS